MPDAPAKAVKESVKQPVERPAGGRIKVSVVVPVYNPGSDMDRCVESLLGQTLPPSERELIFVDDGSTDDTPERLDKLAEEHPDVRVIHIPNSGWPGKPRNVGVDAAQGEYIQYVDQDDYMGLDALRRLYELGSRNGADIVIGKVVSNFRAVPAGVWKTNRDKVTIRDFHLWDSLTPHKMFRKAFLDEEKIRFPEGKRRLEDQLYMMQSYFPAKAVSILGDYTCYHYWRRTTKNNAGSTPIEPVGYYNNLREVLDVVEHHTEPGTFRDTIMRRFFRVEMIGRLNDAAVLRYEPDYRAKLFEEIRKLTEERIVDSVVDALPAVTRIRTALLRANRLDSLVTFAERGRAVKAQSKLESTAWKGDGLKLTFAAELRREGGEPLGILRSDGSYFLDPALTEGLTDWRDGNVDKERKHIRVEVSIRNRETATEWGVPVKTQVHFEDDPGVSPDSDGDGAGVPTRVFLRAVATLDPDRIAGGRPLDKGIWDVWVRVVMLGYDQRTRLGTTDPDSMRSMLEGCLPALLGKPARLSVPYFTDGHDNFSLDVDRRGKNLAGALEDRTPEPAAGDGSRIELVLPVVSRSGTERVAAEVVLREADKTGIDTTSHVLPAAVEPGTTRARLTVDLRGKQLPPAGRWRLFGRLDGDDVPETALGLVQVDRKGRAYLHGAPRLGKLQAIGRGMGRAAAARPGLRRVLSRTAGHLPAKWREQLKSKARRLRG